MLRLVWLAFLVVPCASQTDEPNAEFVIDRLKTVYEKTGAALEGIKDKSSAASARNRLNDLVAERDKLLRQLSMFNLRGIQREQAQKKLDAALAPAMRVIESESVRIAGNADALTVIEGQNLWKEIVSLMEDKARARAIIVNKALQIYMLKHDAPPLKLADIERYLVDKHNLKDPWGKEYQLGMKVVGEAKVYFVFTTSPFGGSKQLSSITEPK